MKRSNKTYIGSTIIAAALFFSGCSQQEVALANTMANSAASASGVTGGSSAFNPNASLASPAAAGMAQSQVIGAQMLANPAVLGVGAVGTAISAHNEAQNKAAFGKVTELYADSDGANSQMEMMMVNSYNKQKGTHFKNMQELQDYAKITGYNKQEGTKFTTFTQMREDYNKKQGTQYKTDREFRAAISRT